MRNSQILRFIGLVLGSAFFIPASYIGGCFSGTLILANMDERDISKGDQPHHNSFVLANVPKDPKDPASESKLEAVHLAGLERFKKQTKSYSFLLKKSAGQLQLGEWERYIYAIERSSSDEQSIVLMYSDDDGHTTLRYKATNDQITPISSEAFYPGYMFSAFPYAIGFAAFIFLAGRLLRRMTRQPEAEAKTEAKAA